MLLGCGDASEAPSVLRGALAELPEAQPSVGLRLGGADAEGATSFVGVSAVSVGPAGAIYVLDDGRADVTVFDESGAFVRTIGRRGEGPGEFATVARMGFLADTIWVQDWLRQVTHYFAADGSVYGTRRLTIELDSVRFNRPTLPTTLLETGAMLVEGEPRSTEPPSAVGPVLLLGPTGERRDTLIARSVWRGRIPIPRVGTLRVSPIEEHALVAFDPQGRRVVIVMRADHPSPAEAGTVTIQVWNAAGMRLVDERITGLAHRPVRRGDRDRVIQQATEALERTLRQLPELRSVIPDPNSTVRQVLTFPATHPPVNAARVATDGTIWLRLTSPPDRNTWLVTDERARPRQIVRLPPNVMFHDAANDRVWGVLTDSLDVQYVVRLDPR